MGHDEEDSPYEGAAPPHGDASELPEHDADPPGPEEGSDSLMAQAFGLGLCVGITILGLVWVAVAMVSEEPVDVANTASHLHLDEPAADAPAVPSRPAGPTRMERCLDAARAMEGPLEEAGPALDQWGVHVGAMNQLVVGAITFQQATDFWNQTRLGAQRRIARFRDASAALRHHEAHCPAPGTLATASSALRSCARAVEADGRVLQQARTAIDTWDTHVHHMDMLRAGSMSPEKATEMWLSMWQRGVRELRAYRVAVRDARPRGGCSAGSDRGLY